MERITPNKYIESMEEKNMSKEEILSIISNLQKNGTYTKRDLNRSSKYQKLLDNVCDNFIESEKAKEVTSAPIKQEEKKDIGGENMPKKKESMLSKIRTAFNDKLSVEECFKKHRGTISKSYIAVAFSDLKAKRLPIVLKGRSKK